MQLVVDIGNTRTKAAVFNGRECLSEHILEENRVAAIATLLEKNPAIKHAIMSSVVEDASEIQALLASKTHLVLFDHSTPLPIANAYQSPETLGKDRLAAAIGAWSLYRGKDALIVDAGTAIKVDLLTANNGYLGGSISPGIQMRFKALHAFTGRLPQVEFNKNYNSLTGKNTTESILNGVQNGALYEVQGFIDAYSKQYPDLIIIVTGGDASFFEAGLKNRIFAHPGLVLTGLNEILLFNAKP